MNYNILHVWESGKNLWSECVFPFHVQTILGHGIDCHLMGLREIANELNFPAPEIFTDQSYISSNQFTLSTSQVSLTQQL